MSCIGVAITSHATRIGDIITIGYYLCLTQPEARDGKPWTKRIPTSSSKAFVPHEYADGLRKNQIQQQARLIASAPIQRDRPRKQLELKNSRMPWTALITGGGCSFVRARRSR
jgi:hypothetical protein